MSSDSRIDENVSLCDLMRDIWRSDAWLQSVIPATEDGETNRFFEEGLGHVDDPADLPGTWASLEDNGATAGERASGRTGVHFAGVIVRIASAEKQLTRKLAEQYVGILESGFRGRECDLGVVNAFVFETARLQKVANGLRLWTGQLSVTIHGTRPWRQPQAEVAFKTQK